MTEAEVIRLFEAVQTRARQELKAALDSGDPTLFILQVEEQAAWERYVDAALRAFDEKHPRKKGGYTKYAKKLHAEYMEAVQATAEREGRHA